MVVWDEERGYYPGQLPYGSNLGAPAIKVEDINSWKRAQAGQANLQFKEKYEEILAQAKRLSEEVAWNELVYSAQYNFTPMIGEPYYLYLRENGSYFLSMIRPNSWAQSHVGTFKLDSTQKWIKLD
jgi:hypothetical protein